MKKIKKAIPSLMAFAFMGIVGLLIPSAASASVPLINGGTGGDIDDINGILQQWITNIRIIGVIVIVIAIIIAAVIIGMSLGNATKRAVGISALVSAVIGIVLVMKAPDLANYFINQSQTTSETSLSPELYHYFSYVLQSKSLS
ncbi:TrbC/VirB2 family protein (plasmid) [Cytobacillus oceanisediminis]|uniref:TrbC/VirB2 family protein n=1 Tax=Cytobacillus oceanisediminis TaxID=665099 RepID=UPI0018644CBB|nr:TrbC/VirB2 family protein [Cytobacillus oceanisediminis]QOK30088.1 TrbC/VirB2 family protein [Cytobacillus oceanisediminis]